MLPLIFILMVLKMLVLKIYLFYYLLFMVFYFILDQTYLLPIRYTWVYIHNHLLFGTKTILLDFMKTLGPLWIWTMVVSSSNCHKRHPDDDIPDFLLHVVGLTTHTVNFPLQHGRCSVTHIFMPNFSISITSNVFVNDDRILGIQHSPKP